jgi:hypothetical protein
LVVTRNSRMWSSRSEPESVRWWVKSRARNASRSP